MPNPKILHLDPHNPGPALEQAARTIRGGGLVAYPTESFYAIGADGLDGGAVGRVFRAKGRREDNPVPVIVHDKAALMAIATDVSDEAKAAIDRLTPGPVTLVLGAADSVPANVTAGTGKVGIRIPDDGTMRELARLVGGPITATSANRSGLPGLTDPDEVMDALGDSIDLILDGGMTPGPPPSTILDISVWPPVILRTGRMTEAELADTLSI